MGNGVGEMVRQDDAKKEPKKEENKFLSFFMPQ